MRKIKQEEFIVLLDSIEFGGSEHNLLKFLSYLDFNYCNYSMLLSDSPPKQIIDHLTSKNKKYTHLKPGNKINFLLGHFRFFIFNFLLKKNSKFVIWSHHLDSNRWLQFFLAIFKKKFIIMEQLLPSDLRFSKNSRLTIPLKRFIVNKAKFAIVCADSQVINYKTWFKCENVVVIPNARDINEINNLVKYYKRTKINKHERTLNILTLGRLTDQKNHRDIIHALSLIDNTNIKLYIVGDGPNMLILKEYVSELGLYQNVLFEGHQEDPFKYLAIADIFILNSLYEGLPGALIEAMAASLPCITTDIPGNRDLIIDKKTGITVPVNSPENIAKAIEWIINNKSQSDQIAINAFNYVEQYYDYKVQQKKWQEIIQSLK